MLVALLAFPDCLSAQSGTWTQSSGGAFNWQTSGNWAGGTIAGGANNTADFSTLVTSGDSTVGLSDYLLTIGNLAFGDAGFPLHNWAIDSSGGSAFRGVNTFQLAVASGVSTVTVNDGVSAAIDTETRVTHGMTVVTNSTGTLSFLYANFSGAITVGSGVTLQDIWQGMTPSTTDPANLSSYTVNAGGTLDPGALSINSSNGVPTATANVFSPTAPYTVNGALILNGASEITGALNGTGTVTNGGSVPATLSVGADNSSFVLGVSLSDGLGGGSLGFTKNGSGNDDD